MKLEQSNGLSYISIIQGWGSCELGAIPSSPKIIKKSALSGFFEALTFLENSSGK